MKKHIYFLIIFSLSFSCTPENDFVDAKNKEKPVESFQKYDLSEGGLPLAIKLPFGQNPQIQAQWNASFGRMELTDPQGMNLFISQDTLSCSTKKIELEDGIFKIEYLIDSDSIIYYKSMLPDGSSPYWHFFASFDIGGKNYNIENNPLIEFTPQEVKHMTEIARNICEHANKE